MNEWTDEMTSVWNHYEGKLAMMQDRYDRIYTHDPRYPRRSYSTVDWTHAGTIRAVLNWVEAHGQPPVGQEVA